MESIPTIHMWHDYVCPFCNVEATRIRRIKKTENLDLHVRFHPWPLETANGAQPRAEEEDRWVRQLRPIEPEAFTGWAASSRFWPSSSALLFAAYEAALDQDIEAAERFDLLLRQAIFRRPHPVGSIDTLSALAAEAGLDIAGFRARVNSGEAERHARESAAGAQSVGIRGIPTLVLPGGEKIINPGLKIRRTVDGSEIRNDLEALRELLRSVAGTVPAEILRG